MSESIKDIHEEIQVKIHNFMRINTHEPEFIIINMSLWWEIQSYSEEVIPPEHKMEPDGFWYIYGLKVAVLDGSNLQERHLKVA